MLSPASCILRGMQIDGHVQIDAGHKCIAVAHLCSVWVDKPEGPQVHEKVSWH